MSLGRLAQAVSLAAVFSAIAAADPIIVVVPTLAPNVYGSPSYAEWQANALAALQAGLTSYGDPTKPSYFQQMSGSLAGQSIVTGFPSWLGEVDPGSAFGPNFAQELGNRITFAGYIDGRGTKFSIAHLSFAGVGTGGTQLDWGCGVPGDGNSGWCEGGYTYKSGWVGEIDGPGGPTYITSGPNTQLVDKLWFRGSGNSADAYCPDGGPCTLAAQADALKATAAFLNGVQHLTGTYTLTFDGGSVSGSGTFYYNATPEPSTLALAGLALVALGCIRRPGR